MVAKLFCLVEGESVSNAFPVNIQSAMTVGDLKDAIKAKISNDADKVLAKDLVLWRVMIPDEDGPPILLGSIPSRERTKLKATRELSDEFNEPPVKGFIHVFVQRPPPVAPTHNPLPQVPRSDIPYSGSRPVSPLLYPDVSVALTTIANGFFAPDSTHAIFLNEFVKGRHTIPVTGGGVPGLPRVGKRGQVIIREAPTLLFFDLPDSEHSNTITSSADDILTKYPRVRHLPLFGVSGCGKTRTALELLSKTWGLYFNAGEKDLGPNDMRAIVKALSDHASIYLSPNTEQNTDKVRYLTFGLLYSRLLILDYCLGIPESKTSFTCKRWMLLQAATPAFQEDVFEALFKDIAEYFHRHEVSSVDIQYLVQHLYKKVQDQLAARVASSTAAPFKFLLVLDEAQVLGRLKDGAFLDSDRSTARPILAPILHAFRRVSSDETKVCVMPCGTGLSYYELEWAAGSSSGAKLSTDEFQAAKDASMVVDFPGWTDKESVSSYIERLGQALDVEARVRLASLFPDVVISRLFREFRGRFRPIVSIIEDMIVTNDLTTWEKRVDDFMFRLTTADIPNNAVDKELFHGNLCSELQRVLTQVEADPTTFSRFQGVRATLKFATVAFITQGGFMSYKGELPELVEVAFGRIRGHKGERYTVIDEPFAFKAADNFFQKTDPGYFQHKRDLLATCSDEAVRGKYWETVVPTNLEGIFHGKIVSKDLFNGAGPPHEMFLRRAEIIGHGSVMQSTRHEVMNMRQFLDAHFYHNSEHNGDPVPPFFFPKARESGPDIAFVVRFSDPSTGIPDIVCPVFVQLKLCTNLWRSDAEKARGTVQPTKINNHGIDISQYCKPHKHYISLIVSYPAEITKYFMDEPLTMNHGDDVVEIALTIDDRNIRGLFAAEYVTVLEQVKRLGTEMIEGLERGKRARI